MSANAGFPGRTGATPSRRGGWVLAIIGAALFLTGLILSVIPGPLTQGVPSYPYFDSRAWGLLIESAVVLSAALIAIALSNLSRYAALLTLASGMTATFLGGSLFLLTLLVYAIPVRMGDGTTLYVQSYPQVLLVFIWGIVELFFVPVSYSLARRLWRPGTIRAGARKAAD